MKRTAPARRRLVNSTGPPTQRVVLSRRLRALLLLGALLTGLLVSSTKSGAAPATSSQTANGHALFNLADPRLDEASGIGVGVRSAGVLYVQNDSGDSARFFAIDASTGKTVAVCDVPGATNQDWEDLAVAPDSSGTPSVWLGDIGDNDANRSQIVVYRVDEPTVSLADQGRVVDTVAPQIWRLRYPDGPHDAESLIVDPISHRLYVMTKSLFGRSNVYEAPAPASPTVPALMALVASVRFGFTGTPGGPNAIGQLTATGAAMSADGAILVVRTYTDAYFWHVRGNDIAGALSSSGGPAGPIRIALPQQPQGEGIAIEGNQVIIDSEGVGTTVFAIPLPAAVIADSAAATAAASTAPQDSSTPGAATSSTAVGPVVPAGSAQPSGNTSESKPSKAGHGVASKVILVVSLIGLALLVYGLSRLLLWQMRRRLGL